MLFVSVSFLWWFLPLVLLGNFILKGAARNYFLLVASCMFYAWGNPAHLLLMLFSIAINYGIGRAIHACTRKKAWLALGVCTNLALLGYFKYFNMVLDLLRRLPQLQISEAYSVVLPIGISFFTFQAMSYLIDLYRGRCCVQRNILKLGLYITLFPQLIAGPIVRYTDVEDSIEHRTITLQNVSYGIKRFLYGLGKKMIIANTMAATVDTIFGCPIDQLGLGAVWFGILCYALQIYYDFSGYSDMAIGLGKMLGFHFLENFNYPYLSRSITEFWRRWHISLSTWFREYLYIPLGGNRAGKTRTLINIMIVFALTGFWHGAQYQFLAWGLYNGALLIFERLCFPKAKGDAPAPMGGVAKRAALSVASHLYAGVAILVGWTIFRGNGLRHGAQYLLKMFGLGQTTALVYPLARFVDLRVGLIFIIGILFAGPVQQAFPKLKRALYDEESLSYPEIILLFALFGYSLLLIVADTYSPFIYFQF